MKCQICNFSELKPDDKTCPNCQSDLEVFTLISNTNDLFRKKNNIILILIITLLISILSGIYLYIRAKKAITYRNEKIENLQNENKTLSETIENLRLGEVQEISNDSLQINTTESAAVNTQETAEVNTISTSPAVTEQYVVATGDNLWRIAEKFYNDGFKYAKIASDNNITNPREIVTGTVLKINKEN
ncbi:MAG: LysM peptidoglycan-binding domain-containing protein [Bacteroidales bacterium]|nr:LysM peptidoglycan-binding domain-containing protein [Bacteroidales bacterium]